MQARPEVDPVRSELQRLIEIYALLERDTTEEQECARRWVAAMVETGVQKQDVLDYIERNRRAVLEEMAMHST
jgi:hypothetical protein